LTVLQGKQGASETDVQARAIERAAAFGHPVSELRPLHVPMSAIRRGGDLTVNPEGTGLL